MLLIPYWAAIVESSSTFTLPITNSSSNIKDYLKDRELGMILNLKDQSILINSLVSIFSLDKEQIKNMKNNCLNYKKFDYRNYVSGLKNFIKYWVYVS